MTGFTQFYKNKIDCPTNPNLGRAEMGMKRSKDLPPQFRIEIQIENVLKKYNKSTKLSLS